MSCGLAHRCSSDLMLLWLWHRPVATAPIRSPAWEPPYVTGVALKSKKKKKKNEFEFDLREEKLQEVEWEVQCLQKLHNLVETLFNHRKELALNTVQFAKTRHAQEL